MYMGKGLSCVSLVALVGPWILVNASDLSRRCCLGLMTCHLAYGLRLSLMCSCQVGPFGLWACLCLAQEFMPWIICLLHAVLAQIHLHIFSDQHLWNSSNNHPMLTFIPSDARLLHDSGQPKWVVSD